MIAPKTVTPALRRALDARDGHRCALHIVCEGDTLVPHHRVNRGMGGRRSLNRLSNLVWLCSTVNGLIESDAKWAERARKRGLKLSSHAEPSLELIDHAVHGACWLDDDGSVLTQKEAMGEWSSSGYGVGACGFGVGVESQGACPVGAARG